MVHNDPGSESDDHYDVIEQSTDAVIHMDAHTLLSDYMYSITLTVFKADRINDTLTQHVSDVMVVMQYLFCTRIHVVYRFCER